MTDMTLKLADLKVKSPKDLLSMAEELEIENASTMRKGEMMFEILRERAEEGWEISGDGCWKSCKMGSGSYALQKPIIYLVLMIFTSRPT